MAQDPYTSLDFYGVGGMIQMAARRAKRGAKEVKVPLPVLLLSVLVHRYVTYRCPHGAALY